MSVETKYFDFRGTIEVPSYVSNEELKEFVEYELGIRSSFKRKELPIHTDIKDVIYSVKTE